MFAGGMLLSAMLIFFASWLQWNERQGWPNESYNPDDDDDGNYLQQRRRSRTRVHYLFGSCGVMILIATLVGPDAYSGLVFSGMWTCVAFALMTIVALALLDGIRTQRHHAQKLSDIRSQFTESDD